MSRLQFFSRFKPGLQAGDWLVVGLSIIVVAMLFRTLWHAEPASKLRIRQGDNVYATLSLDQSRSLEIHGPLGISKISIDQGKVRFEHSPCHNQYCVHQGWLNKAGQAAVCLPNQVSIELLGSNKLYDSLNY
jgi:hypothetical protein